jgi:predicted hydrocarbon binding protein
MFGFVSKLMMHHQLAFNEGSIDLLGEKILMFPTYCMIDTLKELEKNGSEYLFYKSFRELGIKFTKGLVKNYKMKNIDDLIRIGSGVIAMAGYGVVKVISLNSTNHEVVMRLEKSSLADQYGKSDHPVDHLFRGIATGFMCVGFNDFTLEGVETSCRAMGAPNCDILIKSKEKFDLTNPLVLKQINRD